MKGRESRGPAATDLLVCFPSRAHLSLFPKAICSPAESSALHHRRPSHLRNGSPQLWAKNKQKNNADNSEPSSPKVTCAGQIKVRTKPNSCKNWQSVMEEIERLHNQRKKNKKKKSAWTEAFGFKKDAMQFLTCLRNIRFDFRCFGAVPASDVASDDDDEEDEDEEEDDNEQGSRDVFSKWFTILQEENNSRGKVVRPYCDDEQKQPPPNALLLMRCRSAPAKSWLEEKEEREEQDNKLRQTDSETDFCEISGKEIGVVGQIQNMILSRSRSWRR